MYKSDSGRDLDTAFTGRTQQKTFPFQSFSSHTSTLSKKLPLQQLICKRKQKNQIHQAPGARTAQESKHQQKYWGACIQHPAHKGEEKKKKVSLKEARSFWSSCQHRSLLIWDCAAAWGHENDRNQMQLQEQRSTLREKGHWIMSTQTGLLHLTTSTEEQRFYINSLCFCTTPQQLFSDKPFSMHGNANNCVLAREEFVLVTCKTQRSIIRMVKRCIIWHPCLHKINKFIFSQTHFLLYVAAYWL